MLRSALRAEAWNFAPAGRSLTTTKSAEAALQLVERYGDGKCRKSAAELESLLGRLRQVRFVWEMVEPDDRLNVAWVLWSGTNPPAEHQAFLNDFLDWLQSPHHRYQAARLAAAWTASFDPRLPSIRIAGDWLTAHQDWLSDPWHPLERRFQLFSSEYAPNSFADEFLQATGTAAPFFAAERLPSSAVRGGLGAEILAAAAAQVETRATQEPNVALRLCDLALEIGAFDGAAEPRLTARRNALQAPLAEALLSPWEFVELPAEARASILSFLLRHYGDPRVSPQSWRAVRRSAVTVMQRWLTGETVAAYFRLASRSKSVDQARLAERREFWMSRLDTVNGVWLLTAAASNGPMAHGRLGGRSDQVGLLLRVGNLTVLELAHETSERIWFGGNPLAPPLYKRPDHIYWPASLVQGVDFSSAFGPEGPHAWPMRLEALLDRNAG